MPIMGGREYTLPSVLNSVCFPTFLGRAASKITVKSKITSEN